MTDISTPEQLYALMSSSDPNVMNENYILTSDIDMSEYDSQSIGKSGTAFTGSFDGGNYIITIGNIDIDFIGFFGYVDGTNGNTIQNLNINYKNDITFNISTLYMGGLCACGTNSPVISKCSVSFLGNTTVSCSDILHTGEDVYNIAFGGFVGYFTGSMDNCSLICDRSFTYNVSGEGDVNLTRISIGGFYGFLDGVNSFSNCSYNNNVMLKFLTGDNVGLKDISFLNIGGFGANTNSGMDNVSMVANDIQFGDSDNRFILNNITSIGVIGTFLCNVELTDIQDCSFTALKDVVVYGDFQNTSANVGIYVQNSSLTNINITHLGDINYDIVKTQSVISDNTYIGVFSQINNNQSEFTISGISVSTNNISYSLTYDNETTNYGSSYIGGFVGYASVPNLNNVVMKSKDITITNSKVISSDSSECCIGGFGGKIMGELSGELSEYFLICDTIIHNFTQGSRINKVYIGGMIGSLETLLSLFNCGLSVNNIYQLNFNNSGIFSTNNLCLGGVFGNIQNINTDDMVVSNFIAVINSYKQEFTFNQSAIFSGGFFGRVQKTSTLTGSITLQNCSVLFGDLVEIGNDYFSGSGIGGFGGYIFKNLGNSSNTPTIQNCVGVFNDYSIIGSPDSITPPNATIGSNSGGVVENVYTISYGSPLESSTVQNMNQGSVENTNTVKDILNDNINTEWCAELLNYRQNQGTLSSSEYLSNILGYDIDTPLTFRNASIQNSMFFLNDTIIMATFSVIKESLVNYENTPENTPVGYVVPNDNSYNIGLGFYYLYNNIGRIELPSRNIDYYTSETTETLASMKYIEDDTYQDLKIGETFGTEGYKVKVVGIGSGLFEIIGDVNPKPSVKSSPEQLVIWIIIITIITFVLIAIIIAIIMMFQYFIILWD